MLKKSLRTLACTVLCGTAFAQNTLGTAADVQGLVTVSNGANVANVQPGNPVVDGNRYVTGSSGRVTLRLAQNCNVSLQPNQSVTIVASQACPDLLASVQSLGGQQFAGFTFTKEMLLSTGLAAAGVGVLSSRANSGGGGTPETDRSISAQ